MKTPTILNPPSTLDVLGNLRLKAEITFQVDHDLRAMNFDRTVVFHADAWESELIWQTVNMIVRQHGGKVEALEALQDAVKKLQDA